jgi:hypothetical protein
MEYKAAMRVILSISAKLAGRFIAIFNKNPKRIPEKVLNNALSFRIVSYRWTSLSSVSLVLSSFVKLILYLIH